MEELKAMVMKKFGFGEAEAYSWIKKALSTYDVKTYIIGEIEYLSKKEIDE